MIGTFTYRNIKPALFFGYQLRKWSGHRYAVDGPEKTIIDYLYLHTEIEGPADFESLRSNKIEGAICYAGICLSDRKDLRVTSYILYVLQTNIINIILLPRTFGLYLFHLHQVSQIIFR